MKLLIYPQALKIKRLVWLGYFFSLVLYVNVIRQVICKLLALDNNNIDCHVRRGRFADLILSRVVTPHTCPPSHGCSVNVHGWSRRWGSWGPRVFTSQWGLATFPFRLFSAGRVSGLTMAPPQFLLRRGPLETYYAFEADTPCKTKWRKWVFPYLQLSPCFFILGGLTPQCILLTALLLSFIFKSHPDRFDDVYLSLPTFHTNIFFTKHMLWILNPMTIYLLLANFFNTFIFWWCIFQSGYYFKL